LNVINEYQIPTDLLKVDAVIKKKTRAFIDHPLASIFRGHNLFNYTNPYDPALSVNDFYKAYACAFLYKVQNDVAIDDITISFIVSKHPEAVFAHLKEERNCKVTETSEGISIIEGDIIPMQIIEVSRINEKDNPFLSGFNTGLDAQKLESIVHKVLERPHPNIDVDTYLETILRANPDSVQELLHKGNSEVERLVKKFGLAGYEKNE
jgi:hypothetical protein